MLAARVNEDLCTLIREAFAGVKLGGGVGLRQAQALDDYADEETCAHERAGDEKHDWSRITSEELNRCNSSLSFFDAEGMRFHLAAYLIAELHGEYHFGMSFALTHLTDYTRSQFALLSPAQRKAVRAFLSYIAEDRDYQFDRPDILRALDEDWTEAASS